MSRDRVSLNGKFYTLQRQKGSDARAWKVTARPSQLGDPSIPQSAEWHPWGAHLFSNEEKYAPAFEYAGASYSHVGYLGVEAGTPAPDTRWAPQVTMGPSIGTITLSTYDDGVSATPLDSTFSLDVDLVLDVSSAAGNATDIEVIEGAGTTWAYILRGQQIAKVNLADLTLADSGLTAPFNMTSILATRSATGVKELSVGMEQGAYMVARTISPHPNSDDWQTNASSKIYRILDDSKQGRIVGLRGGTIDSQVLSGVATMYSPNWGNVDTIENQDVTPTGFAINGSLWMPMYNAGPYLLDPDEGTFYPIMPSLDKNIINGSVAFASNFMGVIFNTRFSLRWQRAGQGGSWGVETFPGNRSTIYGYVTAAWENDRGEIFTAVYDGTTTSILAWRKDGDDPRSPMMSPYGIYSFTGYCGFGKYVGTVNGLRTRGLHLFGINSNAGYFSEGLYNVQPTDSGYTFSTSSTGLRLTEMRRFPHMIKDLISVEFETQGCAATRTITFTIWPDGVEGTLRTLNGSATRSDGSSVNGVVTTNGYQKLLFVDNSGVPQSWAYGRRPKPRFQFDSDSSATSPTLTGVVRLNYMLR